MGLMNWVVMAARAARHSVPESPVARSKDLLLNDEHQAERGYWQKIGHPEFGVMPFKSSPYVVDGKRVKLERSPLLGEHTDDVLLDVIGCSDDEIKNSRKEEY
jgi:benzylsuccinate CoA-transferase BbsF subunit